MDIEQSNISQYLAVLRKQGIVSFRKDGLRVMYKVNYPQILEVIGMVDNMLLSRTTFDGLDKPASDHRWHRKMSACQKRVQS